MHVYHNQFNCTEEIADKCRSQRLNNEANMRFECMMVAIYELHSYPAALVASSFVILVMMIIICSIVAFYGNNK